MDCYNFSRPLKRAFATNQNQTAFTAKTPLFAKPTSDGVVDIGRDGGLVPRAILVIPVGAGSAADAYSLRIWGWKQVLGAGNKADGGGTPHNIWIPVRIAELGVVLGTGTGIANGVVPATELFADTVTIIATGEGVITADTTNQGTIVRYSPASNITAFAVVPNPGYDLIEFDSDQTTNTPTVNVLYSLL